MNANPTRVAIIGGGLAGMSAAVALTEGQRDLDITLFEAKRITGGRAGSFIDPRSGESIDYCQHVAMGCCTNLLKMLERLGIESPWNRYSELSFYHPEHAPTRFTKSAWLPPPLHLLSSFMHLRYLSWDQRSQIATATWAMMRARSEALGSVTASEWLSSHGQSSATIQDYWNVVIASALGESCERVNMASARKVFVDGFLSNRYASDIWVPKDPLAKLFGVDLPNAIKNRGVTLCTGSLARSISFRTEQVAVVRIDDEAFEFDRVILATPVFGWEKLLDQANALAAGLPKDRFASVPSSAITGVHLWFDVPIMDRPHAILVGTLAQWVFRQSQPKQGLTEPLSHYLQVVISASRDLRQLPADEIVNRIVTEIRHAFPQAVNAKLLRSRIVTDPQSVYSISPEVQAMRPASRTALPCFHLAGDFVQTGWPATMEGAVISGRMAASSVRQSLGQQPIEVDAGLPRSWLVNRFIRP